MEAVASARATGFAFGRGSFPSKALSSVEVGWPNLIWHYRGFGTPAPSPGRLSARPTPDAVGAGSPPTPLPQAGL